ncbi:OVARIAN TUMOR DOMAIN-containing deubiquitinating enzyme 7-like [Rutidosis leptorrhynchoides]|uniref:OVARIAN TUMOR DOMAIN-containing deubiquitinating enzyme 7-like n=1 Tax=Rutidosis leptorrhynchoides TaxID=125765 RepID=UPI003A9A409F
MVKTKHQKTKPKKQTQIKKKGKHVDMTQFRAQLDVFGLKIVQVAADGNCFFRALADQLEGNEEEHGKYRNMVVQYIVKNREMFEPFIEDEVPFDDYCNNMEKDGTWAGHMELQAASLVTSCNICIHRHLSPRWYIRNFDQRGARMIHLSYHDEEHYNSVRSKEDPCVGAAQPILIKADADLSVKSDQTKAPVGKCKKGDGRDNTDERSIKMVMSGSGCEDAEKVEQVLLLVDGDVDTAIEYLIAEKGSEEHLVEHHETQVHSTEHESLPCHVDISHGNGLDFENLPTYLFQCGLVSGENENCNSEEHEVKPVNKISNRQQRSNTNKGVQEKIPRNKTCPCGSKKKHKACCGTKPSPKSIVTQTVESRKSNKEKKQGRKAGLARNVLSLSSNGGPPDLGALCI